MTERMKHLPFYVKLITLNMMASSSTTLPVYDMILILFVLEQHTIGYAQNLL